MVIIPNKYYDKDFNRKDWDEIKINNLYENEKETITQDIICNIPYISYSG